MIEEEHCRPRFLIRPSVAVLLALYAGSSSAIDHLGPYSQGNDTTHPIDPAIPYASAAFIGWATGYQDYLRSDGGTQYADPSQALGSAGNSVYAIVSLGDLSASQIAAHDPQGTLTLTFSGPIGNQTGHDLAVFENGFGVDYCELAYVEVSTDGVNFARFPSWYRSANAPVGGYAFIDATYIHNLAGKHMVGFGTPFNLDDLADDAGVVGGLIDLNNINYVRVADIPGNGDWLDSTGQPVYDSWLTFGSGGFDLDGVGVRNAPSAQLTVTLSSTTVKSGGFTSTNPVAIQAVFSEPVRNLTEGAVITTNATVTGLAGSGATFTFQVVPQNEGQVTVALPFGKCQSIQFLGKQNQPSNMFTFTYNTTNPLVTIEIPAPNPTNCGLLPVSVTFNRPVTGFVESDLVVTNAAVGSFSGSGATYSFTLAPQNQGLVSVEIPAGAAQDPMTEKDNLASDTFSRTFDSIPPQVTIYGPEPVRTAVGPVTYTIAYTGTDDVSLSVSDVSLQTTGDANAQIAVFHQSGNIAYVTLSSVAGNGTLAISLAAGTAADAAGNIAPATGPSQEVIVDSLVRMPLRTRAFVAVFFVTLVRALRHRKYRAF